MKVVDRVICLSLLIGATLPAFGDGIAVSEDRKHVTGQHTTIRLEGKQIDQVERLREVELTGKQIQSLQSIYPRANIPHKLEVLSSRYDSCTCGMGVYAIWCRPGEIDVPHSSLEAQKFLEAYEKEHPSSKAEDDWDAAGRKEEYIVKQLILDSRGRMYLDGKDVQETELLAMIDEMHQRRAKSSRVWCSITLDVPPPIDKETDERIFQLSDRIEAYCHERRVDFWALGISREK